jgi:hypothetical protein
VAAHPRSPSCGSIACPQQVRQSGISRDKGRIWHPLGQFDHSHPGLDELKRAIEPERHRVIAHRMYRSLGNLDDVITFMQHHVFAV